MKKILALITIFAAILVSTVIGSANPYQITNCAELQNMNLDLSADYILMNDIDCSDTVHWNSGAGFEPIGTGSTKFTGNFDGQNHTITGLYINRPATSYVGLFGSNKGSEIKNVGLVNVNITGHWHVGGLVGYRYSGTITNSYATGSVSGREAVGGLVGEIHVGTIENSYATGKVSGWCQIGGLVGRNFGTVTDSYSTGTVNGDGGGVGGLVGRSEHNSSITNSYATGAVTGTGGGSCVGGLAGTNIGDTTDSYATGNVTGGKAVGGLVGESFGAMTNSYATGNVNGGDRLGGLVGYNDGTITKSYATGNVIGADYTGGLVGSNEAFMEPASITNSYATGSVSGYQDVGGLVGLNEGMMEPASITNSYATGSVSGYQDVGGLVGRNGHEGWGETSITNSYATGSVIGADYTGGLAGINYGAIINSYYDTNTSGQSDTGKGEPKTTAEMMTQSTFVNWDFYNIWAIIEGYSYPYFQWQIPPLVNRPPVITAITAPVEPVQMNTSLDVSATFSDPDALDTHTALWNWGDGETDTVSVPSGDRSVTGSHFYANAGVYTLTLTVTDNSGALDTESFRYVVVYNSEGGFVTGGGWIMSPEGAYAADPSLTGKANFGFVAKYKKGADTPSGKTEFQFRVAELNFHSTQYQWLVIAGARAKYKGTGTINKAGDYGFMLTAIDGQINGGGDEDKFRIKIWDKAADEVVYDNKMGEADDSDAATKIGGGSIVIHKQKGVDTQAASGPTITSAHAVPTRMGAQIVFTLSADANLTIRVMNIAGRPVRHLVTDRVTAAGLNTVVWNARSDHGSKVPVGMYLVQITCNAGDGTRSSRIVPLQMKR